jgi:hypothetical protein
MDLVLEDWKKSKISITAKKFSLKSGEVSYIAKLNGFKKTIPHIPNREELQKAYNEMSYKKMCKYFNVGSDKMKMWMNLLGIERKNNTPTGRSSTNTYEETIKSSLKVKDLRELKFEVGQKYRIGAKEMKCIQCTRDIVAFRYEFINSFGEERKIVETFQKVDLVQMGVIK